MRKSLILVTTLILILVIVAVFVGLHYNKKAYAERQIDAFIAKQGIPKDKIYDEKFVWDWSKSGDYVKNFHVEGDDPAILYQYFFTEKGSPILFRPYTSTTDYPDVKYPAPTEEK
ncbi:DUF3139 domain-containing protein [Listeria weihenstephanensis]|uniref:DUF3139 domain-containing protein n=1 Tax=Listeria weihenstephanensis TaxID=1006155 RepID=A0A841Z733_9LIST|nr:DUF3139 domain-containing protein [Listeria weihenstephanensis]MBC1501095.1 DUF3139 domain-containing protein [Listeria weihenstephanensis]